MTVGNYLDSLASGIVHNLTRLAVGEVALNLTADFTGDFALQVVPELRHEFVASDHKPILLALIAK